MSLPPSPNPNTSTGTLKAQLEPGNNRRTQVPNDIIVQSREMGEVVPQLARPSIKTTDKTQPKPSAHFVAGGYVIAVLKAL